MKRRDFIKWAVSSILFGSLVACKDTNLKSSDRIEKEELLSGFNPFNGKNPNLRKPHSSNHTFYENLVRYHAHAGIQYDLPESQLIIACAPGVVDKVETQVGKSSAQELIVLLHGELFVSVYYHMREGSRKVKKGDFVKRGQPLAKPYSNNGIATKLSVHRQGFAKSREEMLKTVNSYRDDADYYGQNNGFMEYFVGQPITEKSYEEVTKQDKLQKQLVYDLMGLYKGPGANLIPDTLWHISPGSEDVKWSFIQTVKLMEHRFKINKDQFNASPVEIEELFQEFYDAQPVLFTLPLTA